MKIKHAISTFLIMVIFTSVWKYLEATIYGQATYRVVDDIIIIMMSPFFYITSIWLEERCEKSRINHIDSKIVEAEIVDE